MTTNSSLCLIHSETAYLLKSITSTEYNEFIHEILNYSEIGLLADMEANSFTCLIVELRYALT